MTPPVGPVNPMRYTTLRRIAEDPGRRFVVAFGGGAVPGVAGNLALAYLLEQLDLRPSIAELWGTSAGAVVAGCWGSGTSALDLLDELGSLRGRGSVDVVWGRLALAILLRPVGYPLPEGLVGGKRLAETIARGVSVERIEQCEIPVRLIAVHDDATMGRKVFREGHLQRSILASMAIPGLLAPVRPQLDSEQTYLDGGLHERTPLLSPIAEHSRKGDGRELMLMGTHFDNENKKGGARGFVSRFLQARYVMEETAWRYQVEEARRRDDVTLLLLNPRLEQSSMFDFERVTAYFSESFEVFADMLQNAKLALTLGGR